MKITNIIHKLYYDRIDVSEGTDVIRPSNQKIAIFASIAIF